MKTIALILVLTGFNHATLKAQNDTLKVYRVQYYQLNIPAGWENFLVVSGNDTMTFNMVESIYGTFQEMFNIDQVERQNRKLYNQLTKSVKNDLFFKYKDMGLLSVESYEVTGRFAINANINTMNIQSVNSFSKNTTLDIGMLKLILEKF